MTKKGETQRSWTTAEDAYLIEHAGSEPIRDLCQKLGRSESSVRHRASRLRRRERTLSLRRYQSKVRVCPVCQCERTVFMRRGVCKVCNTRKLIEEVDWELSTTIANLPAEERAIYEQNEGNLGARKPVEHPSRKKTPPKRARKKVDSKYQDAKLAEQRVIEEETYLLTILERERKRKRRRLERIREKFVNL